MGCDSSLLQNKNAECATHEQTLDQEHNEDSRVWLNLSFNDFIKGNICEIYQQYVFKGWINKSSNSIVRWAEHRRSQIERVVKIIKRNNKIDIKIMKEINVLKKLDHPNIVKLHEYFIDTDYVYMVFEPIYGKRIFNQIVGIEEQVLRNLRHIMKQLLQALEYCHNKGVVHLGIAPENLMLVTGYSSTKKQEEVEQLEEIRLNQKVYLKIVGFGESILCEKNSERDAKFQKNSYFDTRKNAAKHIKKRITESYMSPEATTTQNATKQDIWSCGILMQTILQAIFKVPNFIQLEKNELDELMTKNSKSIVDSLQSLDLLRSMLQKDPNKRLSAQDCLNHPYFYDIDKVSPWKITQTFRSLHDINIYREVQEKAKNQKQSKKSVINRGVLYKYLTMYLTFRQSPHIYHNQFLTEFYNLDKNKDGMIQYHELLEGLKNFFKIQEKSARQYVSEIFQNLDKNSNGCIEYSEFVMGTMDISKILSKESLRTVFKEIDKNSDGFIDKQEIQQIFGIDAGQKIFASNIENFGSTQQKNGISWQQFEKIMSHFSEDCIRKPVFFNKKEKTVNLPSLTTK